MRKTDNATAITFGNFTQKMRKIKHLFELTGTSSMQLWKNFTKVQLQKFSEEYVQFFEFLYKENVIKMSFLNSFSLILLSNVEVGWE